MSTSPSPFFTFSLGPCAEDEELQTVAQQMFDLMGQDTTPRAYVCDVFLGSGQEYVGSVQVGSVQVVRNNRSLR